MKSELFKYKILFSTILIIFAAILIFLFHYTAQSGNTEIEKLVLEQARTSFNKDLLYRKWASMQGGVYVPITDSVKPNPYLEVEDREITSTKGKEYTLINPAYMTRQVHAIGNKYYKIKGHITSLDPINPVNAPDKWEQQALNKFKEGFSEFYSKETIGDEQYLRYMGAMKVENSCLHCHEKQGYKLGDVRGGISVSVPFKNFEAIRDADKYSHLIIFIGIFIFFILCLYTTYHILIHEVKYRLKNQQQKLENAERHKKIIRSAINGFIITDFDGKILEVNPSYSKMIGYTEKELIGMNLSQIEKSENNFNFHETTKKNIRKEAFRYESIHEKKEGSHIYVELSESIQPNDGGQFTYFVEDITERKKSRLNLIDAIKKAEENENRFKSYVEHSPLAIYTTNPKGECIYANEKWLKITGLSLLEVTG
ncbi:MAG: PAS domain S-box protein, partial [Bacteroidales bacterium]|nr:PAS domain S-box protein [Bacteroidales bacterium]